MVLILGRGIARPKHNPPPPMEVPMNDPGYGCTPCLQSCYWTAGAGDGPVLRIQTPAYSYSYSRA